MWFGNDFVDSIKKDTPWGIKPRLFCGIGVVGANEDFYNASCCCLSKWKHAKSCWKEPWTKFPPGIIIARSILHKSTICMPLIIQPSGRTTLVRTDEGPKAHLSLALFVMCCINPPFGLIAVIFACWSKAIVARDWDGALLRGKIAFGFAVTGIVVTGIAILAFVLIFYTRDT